MEQPGSRIVVYLVFVFCILLHIEAVYGTPKGRQCLEYNFRVNDLENGGTDKTKQCEKSQNMCFIFWKREIRNGQIHVVVLKKGCWYYENSKEEACGGTKCVSYGLYDRANNTDFCCCQSDLCNKEIKLIKRVQTKTEKIYPTSPSALGSRDTTKEENPVYIGLISAVGIVVLFVTSGIFVLVFWKRMQKDVVSTNDGTLLPSTQVEHTRLNSPVRKGNFGEIWRGTLNSEVVAIKKFHSSQKSSWKHEKDIYGLGLDHSGILKIFGSSIYHEKDGSIGYIIVVEYHPKGSLRQFLKSTTISWEVMCKMSHTIAEALAYLHAEIGGINMKRSCIVHRDITSENILVKEDGQSCVLCDFGLSRLMSDKENGHHVNHERSEVGSLRYMAPEALEGHINLNDITSQLKQIDIYALGIVLWEISSRCRDTCEGYEILDYRLPFEEVGSPITAQSLMNFVLLRKQRPSFPDTWKANEQNVKSLQELIGECWDQDAEARLSASCVCQRIVRLKQYNT